jgi:hypothetical protein
VHKSVEDLKLVRKLLIDLKKSPEMCKRNTKCILLLNVLDYGVRIPIDEDLDNILLGEWGEDHSL